MATLSPHPDSDNNFIAVIDASTKTFKTLVYRPGQFHEIAQTQHEIELTELQLGWFETDPTTILTVVRKSFEEISNQLDQLGYGPQSVRTFGLSTQRESVVAWHKITGQPLYNIILWYDYRTEYLVEKYLEKLPESNGNYFKEKCGLPIASYFSALKIRWLIDNVPKVAEAYDQGNCYFGTIDTWIIWNLTGHSVYVTDVTNAARTLLMNLDTLDWDAELVNFFGLKREYLPRIASNCEIYGYIKDGCMFDGIPFSAIIGNQHAALVGHSCLNYGSVKNTYRRGCFILCNTGAKKIMSKFGLLTTIAYKLGPNSPVHYALEGSIAIGGEIMKWLRDNLNMIESSFSFESTGELKPADHNADIFFVPAFNGLFAPYWRPDARGIICGLTTMAKKEHILCAALEAICYQTRDILEAMQKDLNQDLNVLHADGMMTQNERLMQMQADINGIPCVKLESRNVIGLGTAMIAGQAAGIDLWSVHNSRLHYEQHLKIYQPLNTNQIRQERYRKWKMAVQRALGWNEQKIVKNYQKLLNNIPVAVFFITLFGLLTISNNNSII